MALTIQGINLNMNIQALEQGEGFVVTVSASWNAPSATERQLIRKAQQEGILGTIINKHVDTFAEAKTAIANAVDSVAGDIQSFIQENNR